MSRIILLAIFLLFSTVGYTSEVIVVELVRVVDGDTIVVNVAGWPDIVGDNIGVRVNGCDTPELRDKRPEVKALAYRAKEAVTKLLKNARVIELRNISRGKYFRLVADVYADETNLTTYLIESGLALPYGGGTKPVW